MKFKKLALVTLMSCGFLALGACSTTGSHGGTADMAGSETSVSTDQGSGAETSGAGAGDNFGGSAEGRQQLLHKRTYYFDFDSNVVHDSDKPAILANANYLVAHPHTKIIIEGHTDPRGSREYNVALGERRANAVADLLKSKGVNRSQIRVVSYGAERLASQGRTEQDYQLDRRAIIVYQ